MISGIATKQILQRLEKAVHSGNITEVVPEDLEIEAFNTLWQETQAGQLTILKLLPSVPATSVAHEYSRINSYGQPKGSGFFGERSLPGETNFAAQRVVNLIRLMGEIGPTFLLAALEKTQKALGTSGAQNVERIALRRNILFKKARNIYNSDTRNTFGGTASTRFKGLYQLIDEGTDGSNPADPVAEYGSTVIDLRGGAMTVQNIRARVAEGLSLYGSFNCFLMDPIRRGDIEASMDPAQRLELPISERPFMIGQNIGGIQTQGERVFFDTDNTLSPIHFRPKYTTGLEEGAPLTTPTVAVNAQADNATGDTVTSVWDAASAGSVFYVVTEMVNEKEGLGTRAPAGTGVVAVVAGQEVRLLITPGNPLADSFKVYRGTSAALAATDAWFIYEIAGNHTGAVVTSYDNNLWRPNTGMSFGLRILSSSERAVHGGQVDSYSRAVDKSSQFLRGSDREGNTVAVANLGPAMGIMALASILAEVDRPLMYSACAPEVRNPRVNYVFKNVGTR